MVEASWYSTLRRRTGNGRGKSTAQWPSPTRSRRRTPSDSRLSGCQYRTNLNSSSTMQFLLFLGTGTADSNVRLGVALRRAGRQLEGLTGSFTTTGIHVQVYYDTQAACAGWAARGGPSGVRYLQRRSTASTVPLRVPVLPSYGQSCCRDNRVELEPCASQVVN